MKKVWIIHFLLLVNQVSFLIGSNYGFVNSIQNNTQDELHINTINLSNKTTTPNYMVYDTKTYKNLNILQPGYYFLNLPMFRGAILPLVLFITADSSGLVAKNILEIVDKDAESTLQKNSNSSTPNVATYIQFLDGAQLTALCSALSAVQSGYSYNQNSSIPTKFDDQYIIITNFNPMLDQSSGSLSNLGYYDQNIIDCYRMQIINVSHFGNLPYYNLAIQINKENLGYGLLTPDNTQGQVSASIINTGKSSMQFLYPSFISCGLSSNETFSKNFSRFIIDLQGYLASGQVLSLNNGISIMGCNTIDVGGGFNQDIPMLNLMSNSRDNNDQPIILPNINGSPFINLSVVFGDLQATSNNLMLFSLPTQALTDGVNIEMTQPIAGNYQLVFTSTKDFTDSDGNSIPKGSVFAAQKVFIDPALLKKSNITVNFLGLPNDSNWNSSRIMQSGNVGQTLNFNLQYSVSQNQNILTIMPLSKELFTTKNSVILQQNDFLTELRYLVFFDKSYDNSKRAEVLLDDSFVDAINSQLYKGKSVVLGSEITKLADIFTATFIAYDPDSKISFATNTKSITKEKSSSITDKSSVFSIGMIYNSVALGRLEIPLWYSDDQNHNAPLLFSLNQKEQANFKNILNLDACDYLTLFSYSLILNQSAGNDSLSVQLDPSFIDTINMHVYDGKSVILNMKSQKKDKAFDFNFTAYDSNTHELLAKGSKSIQNSNTSVTAIDMIYASNKISEQVLGLNIFKTTQFALPLNTSDEAQVSLLINAKATGKKSTCKKPKKLDNQVGSKAKKETKSPKKTKEKSIKNKDKKALITSSKTDKKDQSMIDQLEKQNKQLQQEVQELLAQKKSK